MPLQLQLLTVSAFCTRAFADHTAGSTSLCQHSGSSRSSQRKFFLPGSPDGSEVSLALHRTAAAHPDCSSLSLPPRRCHPSACPGSQPHWIPCSPWPQQAAALAQCVSSSHPAIPLISEAKTSGKENRKWQASEQPA